MIRPIVAASLRFRPIVLGLFVALLLVASVQLPRMPVDVLPEFDPPYVEIQTEALGLSAAEVEQLITVPLEADLLHGVAWLRQIASRSEAGLSSIVLVFEPGTDIFRARQMVAERLTQAYVLPNVAKPPAMLQPLSSRSRLMIVGLSSSDVSLMQLSVLARWTIRPRLLSVPGVANVAIWGQRERQLQVLVDPHKLHAQGVSLGQVIDTTGNALWVSPLTFLEASTPGTGGFVDTANQRIGIQHTQPISSAADLAKVTIAAGDTAAPDGRRPLQLGDVAEVVEDHQTLIGDGVVADGSGLLLVVEKFPGASTLDVTQGVEEALAALRPGLAGIVIDSSILSAATYLEASVGNMALALGIGLLLIVLALGVLLRDRRAALVGLLTVPVSVVIAAFMLQALGATLNAMTAAGLVLAVGVLVDDAVVGFDAVVAPLRRQASGGPGVSKATIIVESTVRSRGALVAATAIGALLAVTAVFVGGVAGSFVLPFAGAYLLAVFASMLVAMTLTPALCLLLWSRGWPARQGAPIVQRLQRAHASALAGLIRHSGPILGITLAASVAAVLLFAGSLAPRVGLSALPTFQEPDLLIRWDGPPGTSQPEMSRVLDRASAELRAVPGVLAVGGHVGRAVTGDRVVNVSSGELWVNLDPAADHQRTAQAIESLIAGYPGLRHSIETYTAERVDAVLTGSPADLVVRVYGQDLDVLESQAEQVRHAVVGLAGVEAVDVEQVVKEPTLDIQVDLAAAQRVGIKPGEVRRAATTLLSGLVVGSLFEDQKVFDVVVWGVPGLRHSLGSIQDLLIDTPAGGQVRLGDVATVGIAAAPSVIEREGVFRRLDVNVNVGGRDPSAVAADIRSAISALPFPLEYRAEVLAGYADGPAERNRLLLAILAVAIGIVLILQASLGSWRLAFLVALTLPAAIGGGVAAALLAGGALSLGTMLGFVAVVAIAARNGILMATHVQALVRDGAAPGAELVARAAAERLLPIVTTASATALAFLPFVLLGDRAGFEVVRPMAFVMLGGLVTSTLLTVFVFPLLFQRIAPDPEADPSSVRAIDPPLFEPTVA